MNTPDMIAGLMVRCGHMGIRPNGLCISLNRNCWLQMLGKRGWEPARLRAGDIVAQDWSIVPLPTDPPATNPTAS